MGLTAQLLADVPGNPLEGLRHSDRLWQAYRQNTLPFTPVVSEQADGLETVEWDVVICGGTLGIVMGAALVQKGWRVALIERGILRGRSQEWNISRRELAVLVELGLLTADELEGAIASEYNPARISLHEGAELWVEDVLNVGVDPVVLLETLKTKFLAAGGHLLEQTAVSQVVVHPDGVVVQGDEGESLSARLLLDAMGHFSPISRQARQGQSPDAVCLVVGTCAQGFPDNDTGDLFASITPIQQHCQYFWEAFPARDGRTTYLFTYVDAHPDRPSLEDLFDDYWRLLPDYQGVDLAQLQIQRALFGFFPCYRDSPLQSAWDRILPIGDSSGSQSPLSFGGFGAMMRHLQRLTTGIDAALTANLLDRSALAQLQPYQPNLSVTWLFQKSMSVGMGQAIAPNQINNLLSAVFQDMAQLGDEVLRPFLQDVVQFSALFKTLTRVTVTHPKLVLKIIPQVGLLTLLEWTVHYANLGIYAGLSTMEGRLQPGVKRLPLPQRYYVNRWLEAWRYGSGTDY